MGLAPGYLVLLEGEQNLKAEHPEFQRYRAFELPVIFCKHGLVENGEQLTV